MATRKTFFDADRMNWDEAVTLTADSLRTWAVSHRHWVIAWSGGKDSTTLLTVVLHLLETGVVPWPDRLTICYADTRMELPPLAVAAAAIIAQLQARGLEVRIVMAPMDKRYFVYLLGRGIPPPNNNTFRWCTRQIKVDPMATEIRRLVGEAGAEQVLMLTGVRQGESAIRDGRIAMSCGVNGAECGQGWYQQMEGAGFATLAPLLHWRVCQVWDWLMMAGGKKYGGWKTAILADAYGGDEAQEINARTGCVGCPLANQDTALDAVLRLPTWSHLEPLKELRPLYRELREPRNRLRQPAGERRQDGTLAPNQCRMGPLTIDARRDALRRVLDIQARCNAEADRLGRDRVDILNAEEVARIEELIVANTWPQKWTGNEPRADAPFEELFSSGDRQPMLFSDEFFNPDSV
jgi:DNA sulfur modification protein DndC